MNSEKHRDIVLSAAIGGLLLVGLFLLLNGAPQITRADPGDLFASPGGGGDCSQASPCDLQTALGTAVDGDAVYMAQGIYTGSGAAVITSPKASPSTAVGTVSAVAPLCATPTPTPPPWTAKASGEA